MSDLYISSVEVVRIEIPITILWESYWSNPDKLDDYLFAVGLVQSSTYVKDEVSFLRDILKLREIKNV